MSEKPQVFLSFATDDLECADAIKEWIEENLLDGVKVFYSKDLELGRNWPEELAKKLRGSKLILSLISPNSQNRNWIHFEAGVGLGKGIQVIPMCWGGIKKGELGDPLGLLQAINLPGEEMSILEETAKLSKLSVPSKPSKLILPPFRPSKDRGRPKGR